MTRPFDFLAIGHVTKDLLADGTFTIGGTATYTSVTARRLGLNVAVMTSTSPEIDLSHALAGVDVHVVPALQPTTFENIYGGEHRRQVVHSTACPLAPAALPRGWEMASIALLCPLVGELGLEWLHVFRSAVVAVTPQGWMRKWNAQGVVSAKPWAEAEQILPNVQVLVFSEEDVGRDPALIRRYTELAPLAVVTRGRRGASVFESGKRRDFPAFCAQEVDPTGAGDVFAAAFLARLKETGDPDLAAPFANCAASFAVEGPGTSTIPTREQVEQRLKHGRLCP